MMEYMLVSGVAGDIGAVQRGASLGDASGDGARAGKVRCGVEFGVDDPAANDTRGGARAFGGCEACWTDRADGE